MADKTDWPKPEIRAIQYEKSIDSDLKYFTHNSFKKLPVDEPELRPEFPRLVELERSDYKMRRSGPMVGNLREVTALTNSFDFYRARDVALILKPDIMAELRSKGFELGLDSTEYSFDLVQLKAIVKCILFFNSFLFIS